MKSTDRGSEWRNVRVWVGEHVIAEVDSPDPACCKRYAESMQSRLPFTTVTNEPHSVAVVLL